MNNPERPDKNQAVFFAALISAAAAGFFLRWYLLRDQIFSNDEWHSLFYVLGKSPLWLFTHFSIPGATCVPLNVYTWAVGATFGWSEMLLRLPSLVCGILCVVVCPWLAREIIGARRAAWLALLLAISPQLIFYSRISRPYSAVAFLGFASLLLAARWARSGDRRTAAFFVIAAVLAVYFHLFAMVTVMAPILATIVYHLWARFLKPPNMPWIAPPLRHWIIAGVVIATLSAFLLAVPMFHSMQGTFFKITFTGTFEIRSLLRVLMLLAGSAQFFVMLFFLALLITGAIEQCRRNPWFGWMLVSLYPLHAIALLLSRPDSSQTAVVLVRYSIPLVPVSLLLVACGIQSVLEIFARRTAFHPNMQALTVFACVVALVLAGPLPQIYSAPNNFTSHGVFQHRYEPIDWSHSFYSDFISPEVNLKTAVSADEVSPFYKKLGDTSDDHPIVEFPMMIGDHCNPLYYYQYFHRRPVLVGYVTDANLSANLAPGNVFANTYIDQVLSRVPDKSRLRFRNLIPMEDLSAMQARRVEYIVLHKRFEAHLDEFTAPMPDLPRLYQEYSRKLGPPAYEDDHLAVFQISQ